MKRGSIGDSVVSKESANRAFRYGANNVSGEEISSGFDDKGSPMYTSPMNQSVSMLHADDLKNLHFPFGVDRLPSPVIKTVAEFDVEAPETEEGGKIKIAVLTASPREEGSVSSSLSASNESVGSVLGSRGRKDRGRSMMAIQRAIDVTSDLV